MLHTTNSTKNICNNTRIYAVDLSLEEHFHRQAMEKNLNSIFVYERKLGNSTM